MLPLHNVALDEILSFAFAESDSYIFLHKHLCTQLFEAVVKPTESRFQITKTMFESWDARAV